MQRVESGLFYKTNNFEHLSLPSKLSMGTLSTVELLCFTSAMALFYKFMHLAVGIHSTNMISAEVIQIDLSIQMLYQLATRYSRQYIKDFV